MIVRTFSKFKLAKNFIEAGKRLVSVLVMNTLDLETDSPVLGCSK